MSYRVAIPFLFVLAFSACDAEKVARVAKKVAEIAEEVAAEDGATQVAEAPAADAPLAQRAPAAPPGGPVQIYDKGLNLVRSTLTIPPGWRIYQDISTNPETGETQQYVMDYYGPQGELMRSMGVGMYYEPMGKGFRATWRSRATESLGGVVTDLQLGESKPNDMIERLPNVKQVLGQTKTETFDAAFTAVRGGKSVAGRVYVIHMPVNRKPAMGTFVSSFVMSAPDKLDAAIETMYSISRTETLSPEFMAKVDEISRRNQAKSRRMMEQSQRAHQQRMRNNQASFDAHQSRMKSQSAAFDRANQTWLNNFRGGSSGYDGQAAIVDTIHERQTFRDPSTGNDVARDGVYRYNFSDGRGNIVGTDDPSFQPSGDWQATDPLSPE